MAELTLEASPLRRVDIDDSSHDNFYIALNTPDGVKITGRKISPGVRLDNSPVEESSIFVGEIGKQQHHYLLKKIASVLEVRDVPFTSNGEPVLGYEDPTWFSNEIFCSQVYLTNEGRTNVSTVSFDITNPTSYHPKRVDIVISPSQADINKQLLLPEQIGNRRIDYIKECQFVQDPKTGEIVAFFEFADGVNSNLGSGIYADGQIHDIKRLWTVNEEVGDTIHLSTAGEIVDLQDGRLILPINRSRWLDRSKNTTIWGPSALIVDANNPRNILEALSYEYIKLKSGFGPGKQRIAFGSSTHQLERLVFQQYLHKNDKSSAVTTITIKG